MDMGFGFIVEGVNSIFVVWRWEIVEDFGYIVCFKDFVNIYEFLRLSWWKIGCKDVFLSVFLF